ncbi:hypothetical protein GA565_05055 [Rouxiella sp. S1S-2]|uniref:hypothetical protein n=1 Tax=Rouxiella sp. S1S-2 TaxID=2653856 RepID=UPI001264FCC2|nr:hypothetical protein [Rouxiella sp. S1S-2]KAB7895405.1 hypothetical protein GA565_05055 [Rouxiella sp. S1S-2]
MMFDNNDFKLQVSDISLYENTCVIEGQKQPLSFAIKTQIPAYLSGLPARSAPALELLEQLAAAGVNIKNFFSEDLVAAYSLHQQAKAKAAAEQEAMARQQRERFAEMTMSEAERDNRDAERAARKRAMQEHGDLVRQAMTSSNHSRAAGLVEGMNWMDNI